jgi:LDH2 family malate/lactate/ureidoglycolate dehydrogenase
MCCKTLRCAAKAQLSNPSLWDMACSSSLSPPCQLFLLSRPEYGRTLGRLRLSVADARDLAEGALRGIGYRNDEARIIADRVIDAAMCGYEYSGLAKILNVFESEHFRLPRRFMKVLRETEVSLAFDGGNNVGMLALFHAAQATIKKTAAHGIALVSVTDAWMSGRGAYYVEMIAKHGLAAIHTASSSPLVAPPGGIRPVLGTNPIAIAVPSSSDRLYSIWALQLT